MAFDHAEAGVDLHIHTTASDGSFSPWEVVACARKTGLSAIAITDHDTVEGAREILSAGLPVDLKFITGVEISSSPPAPYCSQGSFHILGYGIDLDSPPLGEALAALRRQRETRNPQMISRLNTLGVPLTLSEVVAEAGGAVVGRPHMAAVMVRKQAVGSVQEAFDRYLAKGCPAYVEKGRIDFENAVSLIRAAGGLPVLAHPVTVGLPLGELEGLLADLTRRGLAGVEAYYSTHSPEFTQSLLRCAESLGLLVTGGSDFHGEYKSGIHLGVGKGDLHIPFDCYATLIAALT
ncbi:PHP domain-containing protein [Desulfoluna sp.]|uniref:PHP domain-containing protein n=1 Tax=Desulfoluna sp. TaxID=2045199 RepID=UPI00262770D5|nr:PHP domain-containing protein [Desulfoluna sp.]